jgi:C-terminal processing protease CtpA/Prc
MPLLPSINHSGFLSQECVTMKLQIILAGTAALLLLVTGPVNAQRQSESDSSAVGQSQQTQRQQQTSDEDSTEYRGSERAALGVMLSEGRDGQISISQVVSGGPAEQAGIRRGDQISKIDDQEVKAYRDVIRLINRKNPNDEISITVQRDGEEKQLNVSLEARDEVFDRDQQFTQRQPRRQSDDRFGRQTSRQDQWQTDRSEQQAYERSQQGRGQGDDRFNQRTDGQQGQWDSGRYADGRQRQYDDRSFQQDRSYRDQYDRGRDEQYSGQTARRTDDRYGDQYRQDTNSQRERFSERQSDRPTLGIGIRSDGGDLKVSQVYRGSPAEDAGLRRGDQIIAVEGRQVRSYDHLLGALDRHDAGDRVTLDIVRNGRRQQVEAQLQETDTYAREGQNRQQRPSQDRQDYSQDRGQTWEDRDRWDDRQRYESDREQRTGNREMDAGRKQSGEPYDADFDYLENDRDF